MSNILHNVLHKANHGGVRGTISTEEMEGNTEDSDDEVVSTPTDNDEVSEALMSQVPSSV